MDKLGPMKVTKNKAVVMISLLDQTIIKGTVHISLSERLSDLVNDDKSFLSVTDATVTFANGRQYVTPFMTVNRRTICTCFPADKSET